ncbi:CppA N-terminal domain-containing protein [Streptococcus moroccensis]|uniref:Catechol 2,3-dioxygenase-like lactoylglutathione lyase family enzyme n=1 Tax=Streptococcus moroccensis TaxID=1451356 RepID=A0ABT9YSI5_9STRE|nr:CppA N-terminal domain-containing protein [Streptococcus moroccensis]MDQ0222961.1 catechol 2,3-dioxygenase-like lactoylglutathione lyase family enzyme [Streptococcus moroccensis]
MEIIPVLKVNNRFLNVDFYTNQLGLKVLHEENAFADLGSHGEKRTQLILEESPSMRTRKVKGLKKLSQIVIKALVPEEIELLLGLGVPYRELYQGPRGWAFTTISPEGDAFLLHAEEKCSDLIPFEGQPVFKKVVTEFAGLSRFEVESISIRSQHAQASMSLWETLLENPPVQFVQELGPDLKVANSETWDLTGVEATVSSEQSLVALAELARAQHLPVFLDKKDRFLTVTDQNGLDITLRK